jgi:putative peptidoglycan lipid II flippase
VPALIGLPLNIFVVFFIYLSTIVNLQLLSVGFVIASASQLIIMIPALKKNKFKYKSVIDIHNKYVRKMGYNSIPIILGVSVNQINVLVDRTIASQILVGGVSALNYASRLNGFVQGIFVWSITTAMYPIISKFSAEENLPNFKNIIKESTVGVSIMTLPITIGTLLFSEQLISVLYGRGAFDDTAIKITSQALFYYSIGIIGFGFRDILTKVFYSLQETKIPMINAALGMLLNIVLNIILSATFTTVLLFTSLHKKIGPFGMKQISISFLKILFASSVMGGLAKLSFNYLAASLSQNLSLLMAIGVGVVSYFVIISFMKIEDVDVIVGAIKKKLGSQLYNVKW